MTSWMRTSHDTFQSASTTYQITSMPRLPFPHRVTGAKRKPTFSKVFYKKMPDIVQYLKGQYVGLIMYFSLVYEHFVFSLLQSPTSPQLNV